MSEHTEKQWEAVETKVYTGDGGFDIRFIPHAEERARRIVACVNACAGYSTEDLEQFGRFISTAENVIPLLEQKCDDLLEALTTIMRYPGIREYLGSLTSGRADKAIAAAEGDK